MMKPISYQNNQNKSDLLQQFFRQMMIPLFIIVFASTLFSYERLSVNIFSKNNLIKIF